VTQNLLPVARFTRTSRGARLVHNMWPPLLFAGIRIQYIADDFRHIRVRLAKSLLTSNMFGTQFGGSIFAMTDPFWVVMLSINLGSDYTVWDHRAEIEFLKPGRTALVSEFTLTAEVIDEIRAAAAGGEKVLRWFGNEVHDREGNLVARTRKQVYVRLAASSSSARSRTSAGKFSAKAVFTGRSSGSGGSRQS
jgi:acyl-coenzyme A thioesterase PaaI-like protein